MQVVQFNFNDGRGGATRAAMRQHQALLGQGVDSRVHVLSKETERPEVLPFDYRAGTIRRLTRRLRKLVIGRDFARYRAARPEGYEQFSDDRVHLGADVFRTLEGAQVANLHWIAGYCDYAAIHRTLRARLPVVWTMHDQNPFTGGCHYDHGCGRFQQGCGRCPQLGSLAEHDLSAQVLVRKRDALSHAGHAFVAVAPSRWLAAEAAKSALFRDRRIEVIPYGLDTDLYRPASSVQERVSARNEYGLSASDGVILFLASGAGARRKGFHYLDQAMTGLPERDRLTVVSVGGKAPDSSGAYRHLHLGSIMEEERLAAVYRMADLFVIPSIEDNLPLACQESLACGTPVIGFAAGGIPDMVVDGLTGLSVAPKDTEGLGRAIAAFFADPGLCERLGLGAREHAVRNYAYARNAAAYCDLYESLR